MEKTEKMDAKGNSFVMQIKKRIILDRLLINPHPIYFRHSLANLITFLFSSRVYIYRKSQKFCAGSRFGVITLPVLHTLAGTADVSHQY